MCIIYTLHRMTYEYISKKGSKTTNTIGLNTYVKKTHSPLFCQETISTQAIHDMAQRLTALIFSTPLGDATPLRGLLLLMDPIGLAEQTHSEQRHSVVLGWWGMVSTSHFLINNTGYEWILADSSTSDSGWLWHMMSYCWVHLELNS